MEIQKFFLHLAIYWCPGITFPIWPQSCYRTLINSHQNQVCISCSLITELMFLSLKIFELVRYDCPCKPHFYVLWSLLFGSDFQGVFSLLSSQSLRWDLLVCNSMDLPLWPSLKIEVTFSFSRHQEFLLNVAWRRDLSLHTSSIHLLKLTLKGDTAFFRGIPEYYMPVFWLCYNSQFVKENE